MDSHDEHSHGEHAHDEHGGTGDYNAEPLPPSKLPPLHTGALLLLGATLAIVLSVMVMASFRLANAGESSEAHAER